MLHRAFVSPGRPLVIVGQTGVEAHLERLFELCWHAEWPHFRELAGYTYDEGRDAGVAAGTPYRTVPLRHGRTPCRGYRLELEGRSFVYAGDTQMTPDLDRLVEGAEIVVTEATAPGPSQEEVHTSWEQAGELAERHPRTRFFFNHLYSGNTPRSVSDLEVVDV